MSNASWPRVVGVEDNQTMIAADQGGISFNVALCAYVLVASVPV